MALTRSALVVVLLAVGAATSCSTEPRQLAELRKLAATLPVPAGAELTYESFVANTPGIFDDEQYSGTIQYATLREVNLEDVTADVVREFESAGWTVTNLSTDVVDENLAVHKGTFIFEKAGESGTAYLDYALPPVGVPMKKPAKVEIAFNLAAT